MPDSGKHNNNKKAKTDADDDDDWKKCSLDSTIGSAIFHPPKTPFRLIEEGRKVQPEKNADEKLEKKADEKPKKKQKSKDKAVQSSDKPDKSDSDGSSSPLKSKSKDESVNSKTKSPNTSASLPAVSSFKALKKDLDKKKKKKHHKSSLSSNPNNDTSQRSATSQSSSGSLIKHFSSNAPFGNDTSTPIVPEPKYNRYLVSHPYGHPSSSSDSSSSNYTSSCSQSASTNSQQVKLGAALATSPPPVAAASSASSSNSKNYDSRSVILSMVVENPPGRNKSKDKVNKGRKTAGSSTSLDRKKRSKKLYKESYESNSVESKDLKASSTSPLPSDDLRKGTLEAVDGSSQRNKGGEGEAAPGSSIKKKLSKGAVQSSSSSNSSSTNPDVGEKSVISKPSSVKSNDKSTLGK